jgi:8-oxo-dGTP pyrophosphatase MutT (NUDIX family)
MFSPRGIYQVSLKVFLKNSSGQTLILKTPDGQDFFGSYDLPGGRIDADEFLLPFAEVIDREIKEEVGDIAYKLDPNPVALGRHLIKAQYSSDHSDHQLLYAFFAAEYQGGEIRISPEHCGYKWLDLSEIKPEDYFMSGILEGAKIYLNK